MWAQGVPAVVMVSREVRDFRSHYNATCNNYDESLKELRQMICDRFETLPQQVVDTIRETLIVEGAVQVTSADIRRIVSELLEAPGGKMDLITNALATLTQTLSTIGTQPGLMNTREQEGQLQTRHSHLARKFSYTYRTLWFRMAQLPCEYDVEFVVFG